jgi:hypothetical protein
MIRIAVFQVIVRQRTSRQATSYVTYTLISFSPHDLLSRAETIRFVNQHLAAGRGSQNGHVSVQGWRLVLADPEQGLHNDYVIVPGDHREAVYDYFADLQGMVDITVTSEALVVGSLDELRLIELFDDV